MRKKALMIGAMLRMAYRNNKVAVVSSFIILFTVFIYLCSCQKRPRITVYLEPSSYTNGIDELLVQDGKYQEALNRCAERLDQVDPDSIEAAEAYKVMGGFMQSI